jgi:nicotinate-nucleotide pyrophosphorylase (carboxylating)
MQRHEPPSPELDPDLDRWLAEDIGPGDVTTESLVSSSARGAARLIAKEDGVLCGLPVFLRVFQRLDPAITWRSAQRDGQSLHKGDIVCELEGSARALLSAERTALNLIQRMSGIATLTRRFVDESGGVRVLDTRKTTPGMRALEKYAVVCGGGNNHRRGLFDQAMVKDNHVDLSGVATAVLVQRLRSERGPELIITAEARSETEALEAIRADADVVLLDNFEPEELARLVPRLRAAARARPRPLELEASGGIRLETLRHFAAAGVDRISVGALTHSAPALDLSLELRKLDGGEAR